MVSLVAQYDQLFEVSNLPCMSGTLLQLIELYNANDINYAKIIEVIKNDPALTARIITFIHSLPDQKYQLIQEFDKLQLILDLDTLKSITATAMIQQYFSGYDEKLTYHFSLSWLSSLRCAYTASALARLIGYRSETEAYMVGLLHSIGKVSFLIHFNDDYLQMLENSGSLIEQNVGELKLANMTTVELTSKLLKSWSNDSFVADAVLYQNESTEAVAESTTLIKIINAALKVNQQNVDGDLVLNDVSELLNVPLSKITEVLSHVDSEIQAICTRYGMQSTDAEAIKTNAASNETAIADAVKNLALVNTLQKPLKVIEEERKNTILQIMQELGLLFDLRDCIWFEYSSEKNLLEGSVCNLFEPLRLQELSFEIEKSQSLVAASLRQGMSLDSYNLQENSTNAIIDQQLINLLKADGLMAIPFISGKVQLGVMVAGLSQANSLAVKNNYNNLLTEFVKTACITLIKQQEFKQQQTTLLEEQASAEKLRIRKLVHEANNPLAIMRNYLQILSVKLETSDESINDHIKIILQELERVSNTMSHIRDDVVISETESGLVDINVLIKEMLLLFSKSLFKTHHIEYQLNLEETLPAIQSSHNKIKQIITNLIKNSVEAMPDGGNIIITSKDHINFNGAEYIELIVADSGPGIPDNIMQTMFEPVKTTKDETHSGLGLTIVKNLVTHLGGGIRCNNLPGRGVEFGILLPRVITKASEEI